MKYPRYAKYKDSGVEWLGKVPEHWGSKPLKHECCFINGMAFKPDRWSDEGVPIIRIENLNGGTKFNCFDGPVPAKYHVRRGDLLFGWSGNRGTSFGPFLWWRDGLHYLNQHIFRLTGFSCDKAWFYWCLKAVTRTIEDEAHGIIGMVHITQGRLGSIQIPMIALGEQRTIATFLDRETVRIDRLIEKKRALIELLREKRQALISCCVTRGIPPEAARAAGLDPHPKMKDSGIEWIGEVPEHWETRKFGREITIAEGQVDPEKEPFASMCLIGPNHIESGTGLLRKKESATDQGAESGKYFCRAGNVLYSKIRPALAKATFVDFDCLCSADMYPLNGSERLQNRYLLWILLSDAFTAWSTLKADRVAMPKINRETLYQYYVALPPVAEQLAIAAFLDRETAQIDRLIAKAGRTVETLQEYRTALITAAVSGKIDVREAASSQTEEIPGEADLETIEP